LRETPRPHVPFNEAVMYVTDVEIFYADRAQCQAWDTDVMTKDLLRGLHIPGLSQDFSEEDRHQPGWYWRGFADDVYVCEGPCAGPEEPQPDIDHSANSPTQSDVADVIAEKAGLRPRTSRTKQ